MVSQVLHHCEKSRICLFWSRICGSCLLLSSSYCHSDNILDWEAVIGILVVDQASVLVTDDDVWIVDITFRLINKVLDEHSQMDKARFSSSNSTVIIFSSTWADLSATFIATARKSCNLWTHCVHIFIDWPYSWCWIVWTLCIWRVYAIFSSRSTLADWSRSITSSTSALAVGGSWSLAMTNFWSSHSMP